MVLGFLSDLSNGSFKSTLLTCYCYLS